MQQRLQWFALAWMVALIALKGVAARFEIDADVRRLSREIAPVAARLSRPLVDFAFVEGKAVPGLRLYTGKPVFEAVLPGADPRRGRLYTPLVVCAPGSAAAGRLWLVARPVAGAFLEQAAACGLVARPLGPALRRWLPYELLPAT
jgi:hypothetical protein